MAARLPTVRTKHYTYHIDALEMLEEMCPTSKSPGQFLSELVRKEYAMREERRRLKALLFPEGEAA